jgi:hypothetical protein
MAMGKRTIRPKRKRWELRQGTEAAKPREKNIGKTLEIVLNV